MVVHHIVPGFMTVDGNQMSCAKLEQLHIFGRWRAFQLSVGLLAIAFAAASVGAATAAEECSIEAHGPNAYEQVKKKIEERFYKSPEVIVEPYSQAEITLQPDCVLELRGRFTAKERGRIKRKVYEAQATPKEGAPRGIKILKLKIDNG